MIAQFILEYKFITLNPNLLENNFFLFLKKKKQKKKLIFVTEKLRGLYLIHKADKQ